MNWERLLLSRGQDESTLTRKEEAAELDFHKGLRSIERGGRAGRCVPNPDFRKIRWEREDREVREVGSSSARVTEFLALKHESRILGQ